jgi:hypothetical protein
LRVISPPNLSNVWILLIVCFPKVFQHFLSFCSSSYPINNNTFFFATIDKVLYYVSFVLTTCFGPYIRPSSGEFTNY